MSRIHKLETYYQEKLKDHRVDNISVFVQSILDADITKGKYARFLIESFLNDKFLEEDLIGGLNSTVGQTISLFHKHKNKLPEDMRSIFKYNSPGDLWNSVKQYQGELSGKELKREEQEQIYRETEFVYKNEETGFQIVSPLTKDSAKWWSKGTRWCTSAENNNMFKHYAKHTPLFILLMPASASTAGNGDKLQLWKNGNDIQFMDEADNEVTLEYIEQNWKLLEPICLWLNDFRFIPDKYKTQEICLNAFKKNLWALQYIPKELRTKELYELAVRQDGRTLEYIPKELRTKELCELAIQQNGRFLEYIPKIKFFNIFKFKKNKKLCEIAVQKDGLALEFVPKYLKTKKICEIAVQKKGAALRYIPEYLKTEELCEIAVQKDGLALKYVPNKHITPELCEMAVEQDGNALKYVPKYLKTEELCKIALNENGYTLQFVPDEYITQELCNLIVQQNGMFLTVVPEEYKTKELCESAIVDSVATFQYVPEHLKTKDFYTLVVQKNGIALEAVPEEYKTKELCEIAVQKNGTALYYVPLDLKTKELCEIAVKNNGFAIYYVPDKLKSELQHYLQETSFELPINKYQETFQEIKLLFLEKEVSLHYHHS